MPVRALRFDKVGQRPALSLILPQAQDYAPLWGTLINYERSELFIIQCRGLRAGAPERQRCAGDCTSLRNFYFFGLLVSWFALFYIFFILIHFHYFGGFFDLLYILYITVYYPVDNFSNYLVFLVLCLVFLVNYLVFLVLCLVGA